MFENMPGGGHTKEEIIAAAKKTMVKLYENDDCSGDELEFKVSHSESECKYCLDTCHERYTTNPNKDVHVKRPKSIRIFDDDNIGFLATTYGTCSGSYGYTDPKFQNSYISGGKCVKLPLNAEHFIFWAPTPANPNEYASVADMDERGEGWRVRGAGERWGEPCVTRVAPPQRPARTRSRPAAEVKQTEAI